MKSHIVPALETLLRQPEALIWEFSIDCVDAFCRGCACVFPEIGVIKGFAEEAHCAETEGFHGIHEEARFRAEGEHAAATWLVERLLGAARDGEFGDELVAFSTEGFLEFPAAEVAEPFHPALFYWAWEHSSTMQIQVARRIEALASLHRGYVWALQQVGVASAVLEFELRQFALILACLGRRDNIAPRFWEPIAKLRKLHTVEQRMAQVMDAYWWWLQELYDVRSAEHQPAPPMIPVDDPRVRDLLQRQQTGLRELPDYASWRRRLLMMSDLVDAER